MAYREKKHGKKRNKARKHAYSIMQADPSYCYLCARLYGDETPQKTEEHHIFFGTRQRDKSEAEGLKVRLCIPHHRTGPEAVHRNMDVCRRLQIEAQEMWEAYHSHAEWMALMGRNYLEDETDATPTERIFSSFKEDYPNLAAHTERIRAMDGEKERIAVQLDNGRVIIYDRETKMFEIWRGGNDNGT